MDRDALRRVDVGGADGRGDAQTVRAVRRAGRMLCKSVCDDHLTGGGLASFVLEYLVHGAEGPALSSHEQRVAGLPSLTRALALTLALA